MSTIKFGIRSVQLQKYSSKELGLDDKIDSELIIEYRQNYFHLHFLPVFPTSKFLRIRNKDKELYEVPENIKIEILAKIKDKPKTPWFTFLAPLLLIIGLSVYLGVYLYDDYKSDKYFQNEFSLKKERALNSINNLNTNTYLKLGNKHRYHTFGLYAKVEKINNDSILLLKLETDLSSDDDILSYQVKKFYLQSKLDSINLESTWTTKKTLLDGVLKERQNSGANRIMLFDEVMTILDGNEILSVPLLKPYGFNPEFIKNGKDKFDLINYGISSSIEKIENVYGEINWITNFPNNPRRYGNQKHETFRLNFENFEKEKTYHSKIHLIDKDGIKHVYDMKIGVEIEITNANKT